MPTFANGESAASVRTKINDAIDKVDGAAAITSVNIDGGTIDGVTIGGASAGAGTFTTLTATGNLTVDTNTLFVDAASNRVGVGNAAPATALDVTGTVKSDGALIEGNAYVNTNSGLDAFFITRYGNLEDQAAKFTVNDNTFTVDSIQDEQYGSFLFQSTYNGTGTANRLNINNDGDISFYEDTGTTPKFFWDASTERLGIGNAAPATALDVTGTITSDGLAVATTSAVTATFSRDGTDGDVVQIFNGAVGTTRGLGLGVDGTNGTINSQFGGVKIQPSGTTSAFFGTGGDISFYEDTGTTPKFFWDASAESLGIGTSSPQTNLSVASSYIGYGGTAISGDTAILSVLGGAEKTIRIDGGSYQSGISTANLALSNSGAQNYNSSTGHLLRSSYNGSNNDTFFSISSSSYNGTAYDYTERMRIDSSGNVGIGVTPSAWGSGYRVFQIGDSALSNFGTGYALLSQNALFGASSNTYINSAAASYYRQFLGAHAWFNAPSGTAGNAITFTQAMTLDANGALGIGTSSPQVDSGYGGLTINGTNGSILTFRTGDSNSSRIYTTAIDNLNIDSNGSASGYIVFRTGTSSTERMRIDSSGNVGIGTTSPGGRLSVVAPTGSGVIDIVTGSETADSIRLNAGGSVTNWLEYRGYLGHIWFDNVGERMRIDSSGNVGIGVTPSAWNASFKALQIAGRTALYQDSSSSTLLGNNIYNDTGGANRYLATAASTVYLQGAGEHIWLNAPSGTAGNAITFTQAMTLDASGNLGIGTTSPFSKLQVASTVTSTGSVGISVTDTTASLTAQLLRTGSSYNYAGVGANEAWLYSQGSSNLSLGPDGAGAVKIVTNGSERMRIDSSGRVGIGTSSPSYTLDAFGSIRLKTGVTGTPVIVETGGTSQGTLRFGSASNEYSINGGADYLAMIFNTDASERMRIDSSGNLLVGKTANNNDAGVVLNATGVAYFVASGTEPLAVNRLTSDGTLVTFYQDNTAEGNISVTGSTVSYNGGHLSRWAQMPDGSRPDLLKGTVMSNLDQMSNWHGEDNEQLNCVQVSTVEGDPNVAGVFVAWDSTDDDYNDILLAMTGDMVIRIAAGTTVQRGDLLMSAGDGTAKPQGDDIVRSKTIAKVTSTHVSHTYADGSYAVPCVLMAC